MPDRILILGASARAAAASARRAGLVPFAVDLFADRDTQLLCERVWRCPPDRYPHGLFELARDAPPMPWMYTGGLENYPELVGELARERELWGNGPDVLRLVRNPGWLFDAITDPEYTCPPVILPGKIIHSRYQLPSDSEWMCKPLRGSGGHGIRPATSADRERIANPNTGHYLQVLTPGKPASVVFRGWRPIGFTRQLIGTDWLHAPAFGYAGNVFWPVGLGTFVRLMRTLPRLTGIWGADLLVHDSSCSTLEINPRYPASVEVIEHSTGLPALSPTGPTCGRMSPIVGKAVYYAPHRLTFPAAGPWDDSLALAADVWHRPDFADIPHPGDIIEPGQPVLTILTDAPTEAECLARLKARAADLDRLFGHAPTRENQP